MGILDSNLGPSSTQYLTWLVVFQALTMVLAAVMRSLSTSALVLSLIALASMQVRES